MKGDGEAHPFLSPNDEFAAYENWDKFNLNMSVPKENEHAPVRVRALPRSRLGLQLEAKLGTNPYKFGMIGSTDTHTGLSTAEEDNFFGKHAGTEPNAKRMEHPVGCFGKQLHPGLGAGRIRLRRGMGDREHTRGDLRRHGAQGNLRDHRPAHGRALLRRLGLHGSPTPPAACPPNAGYAKGVPMGGDLRSAPGWQVTHASSSPQ